jgi:hypothetical protein
LFTVGSLILIILGTAGCAIPKYSKIRFDLVTGGDDFRGDRNERLQAQLLGAGGGVLDTINQVNVNGVLTKWSELSEGYENPISVTGNPNNLPKFSRFDNTITLTNPVRTNEVQFLRLELLQGDTGINGADNWNLGGIRVYLISDSAAVTNVELISLGGGSPPLSSGPLYVWRFKVKPDSKERNSGSTVKINVPSIQLGDAEFPPLSP